MATKNEAIYKAKSVKSMCIYNNWAYLTLKYPWLLVNFVYVENKKDIKNNKSISFEDVHKLVCELETKHKKISSSILDEYDII